MGIVNVQSGIPNTAYTKLAKKVQAIGMVGVELSCTEYGVRCTPGRRTKINGTTNIMALGESESAMSGGIFLHLGHGR